MIRKRAVRMAAAKSNLGNSRQTVSSASWATTGNPVAVAPGRYSSAGETALIATSRAARSSVGCDSQTRVTASVGGEFVRERRLRAMPGYFINVDKSGTSLRESKSCRNFEYESKAAGSNGLAASAL